jgi:type IV pilus assembly protein PilW
MSLDGNAKSRILGGFTLIELMVAIALGLVVMASVATTFTSQTRAYSAQEQINQMEQNLRGALDIMSREIKMAGYKPNGGTVTGVVSYSSTGLTIQADVDGNGSTCTAGTLSSVVCSTAYEQIAYAYDSANQKITRQVADGTVTTLAENISAFSFAYSQAQSGSTAAAATSASNIRQIAISITGKTAKPDPGYTSNGGYRTVTLSATITPINLGL